MHSLCALLLFVVIECNRLQDVLNGRVLLSGTTVGSTATYNCDKGFVLIGDSTRVCQRGGDWSGKEPFCEGSYRIE